MTIYEEPGCEAGNRGVMAITKSHETVNEGRKCFTCFTLKIKKKLINNINLLNNIFVFRSKNFCI